MQVERCFRGAGAQLVRAKDWKSFVVRFHYELWPGKLPSKSWGIFTSGDQRLNDHITAIRYTGDRRIFGLRLRWVPGHQEIDIRKRLPACRRRHFVEEWERVTASSFTHAEYLACYEATCQAILLRNWITGLKVMDTLSRPLKIYCENSAALVFSNNKSSSRLKEPRRKVLCFEGNCGRSSSVDRSH